ncbi:MAG: hypothetical protein ACR2II_00540 [Chthoniobacterales bacterium]
MKFIGALAFRCSRLFFAIVLGAAAVEPLAAQQLSPDSPRWLWFEKHKDNFDIVFLGSSRIYHGVSPKLFDRVAAEHGQRWRSFNLGVDKMRPAATLALARRVLELQPRNLKYLFFELQTRSGPGAAKTNDESDSASPQSPQTLGWLQAALGGSPSGIGPYGDGFNPLNKTMTEQMRPNYERRLRSAREHTAPRRMDPEMRSELSSLVRELAARNITAVFVVAPSLRAARGSGVDAPSGSLLFSFDDLDHYAALYDEANRPDAEHLNSRGAEIFTRTLAQQFAQALRTGSR